MKRSILLALLAIAWLVVPVRAAEPGTTTNREQVEQKRQELQASREELASAKEAARQARCETIATKINFRLNQSEQNRNKHYQAFQVIKERIQKVVKKFEVKGCDVAKLQTDYQALDVLIAEFSAAHRDYTTSLQAARENRCTEKPAEFTTETQEARQKLSVVRQKSLAVKTFIKNTLQPELKKKLLSCTSSPKPSVKPSASPTASPVASPTAAPAQGEN